MKSIHCIAMIALAGTSLAITSCATGGRSPSGFLLNYQQLDAGYGTADAVSAYVKPDVDLKKYNSVIIDPIITVVATPGVSADLKNQLAAYLGTALASELNGKMQLVSIPGPNTLRVRVALTDVVENQKLGKPVTTVHTTPSVKLIGNLGSESVARFISNVSFEGEILDSVTSDRLCALCDHRLGAKREAKATTSWASVQSGINFGAAKLWQRFVAARDQ